MAEQRKAPISRRRLLVMIGTAAGSSAMYQAMTTLGLVHEAPRDGIIGFGGGGRSRSTSRIPSSEIQAISQNASM